MPISYKHKIYTTLGTPTDLSGDVVSATDSAGVPAKDYTVKGKTIVWNQLLDKSKYPATTTTNGVTFTNNGDGTITANGTATANAIFAPIGQANPAPIVSGHKFLFTSCPSGGSLGTYFSDLKKVPEDETFFDVGVGVIMATTTTTTTGLRFNIRVISGYTANNLVFKPQLFDLTQMFGAGNEPATPEEFRAIFPDDYYPYNVGELKTIVPTSADASGVERFQLLDKSKFTATKTINGVTFTNNGDGTITVDGTGGLNDVYYNLVPPAAKSGHKYMLYGCPTGGSSNTYDIVNTIYRSGRYSGSFSDMGNGAISRALEEGETFTSNIFIAEGYTANNLVFKPQLFDLTQMFGAGNEPTTPAEFWQRVPEKLYGYNPSAYKSVNIPSSKYFPDGMRSAGSVYDEINFLSQKAIKRIGVVDMGTLNWKSNTGTYPTNSFYSSGFTGAKGNSTNIISNTIFKQLYINSGGLIIALTNDNETYESSEAFKAAMSGVMLYYELATPVETAITPPLQALQTFKGFTSFSAPNSLMQNGPLSVTYYAEGGESPEKGWLTSYKRKLYMGRTIEWNQLVDKSKFQNISSLDGISVTNNNDGSIMFDGTKTQSVSSFFYCGTYQIKANHKYYLCGAPAGSGFGKYQLYSAFTPTDGSTVYSYDNGDGVFFRGQEALNGIGNIIILISQSLNIVSNITFKPQLFDLTQMFGAGNEPATPEEFWSYFDHKLYPYNAGETQPLFKISRKSQWGAAPKHYTARWDKVNAAMVRLNDAASFPTDVTNFAYRGSVNANYSNPFDNIYPWSGIKLCNISIDLYRNLVAGDSITKCVTAWEGDANFSYNDVNGVWRYRPEFWGKSWEDDTYRYFDVTDQNVHGSNYVHYPEAIVGRWHGRNETLTIGGAEKTCLVPSVGMPAKRIAMSTLHTYAKNYGATIDSIYSIDADTLLCIVEFATMNTQNAIGEGVCNLYRQSSDLIQEDATNSTTVKVLATAGNACCIPGAIFDIGTSNGGNQVGSFTVVSATPNVGDAQYLDVTLDRVVTVTSTNYWSVHGLVNVADEAIGSKSGYIGTNGKCNAYYRGIVMFGNMWFYILGAYENKDDHHIWIANSDAEADNYDALDTTVHYDTGLVLAKSVGYTKNLGLPSRSGLLSIPAFCIETGGNNNSPVGDYFFNDTYTYNTTLQLGGSAATASNNGAFCCRWTTTASFGDRFVAARPRLKNP